MPLIETPYQPLIFAPFIPTACNECVEGDYAFLVQPDDFIYWQGHQTPCHASITCDGDFTSIEGGDEAIPDGDFNAVGSEEITNGTFPTDAVGWTLGTGWAWNAAGTGCIRKTAGAATAAVQTLGSTLVTDGIYKVVFTVSNYSAGSFTAGFAGGVAVVGAVISSNGTKTQYLKATAGSNIFGFQTDATFAGDIDTVSVKRIAASWDFQDEWTINAAGHAFKSANNPSLTCAGCVQPNTNYTLTVHITDGNGFIVVNVGGTLSTVYNVTGGAQTITQAITSGAGTDLIISQFLGSFTIEIQDISLIEIEGDCWTFDIDQWTATDKSLCKTPGASDTLINSATLLANTRYQIRITVNGRTQGSILMSVNLVAGAVIDDNGTFIQYFTPLANSNLSIFANSLFDGCLSNIEIFELRNDFLFQLRDLDDNTIAIISDAGFVRYFEDYVTLKMQLKNLLDVDNHVIQPGCYKIWAFDLCELQYQEIIVDGEFVNPFGTYWVDTGGSPDVTNTITGGVLIFDRASGTGNGFGSVNNLYSGLIYTGNPQIPLGSHNYHISFEITENSDDVNISVNVQFGTGQGLSAKTVGVHAIDIFNVNPTTAFQQSLGMISAFIGVTGTIKVDNVSVYRIEPYDVTYTSPIIKYGDSFPCTSFIQAYATEKQMGFEFTNSGFKLGHRLNCKVVNPAYPEDTNDYLYSTGLTTRNFGQSKKKWNLLIGLAPEYTHDAIRLQRILQYFEIEDSNSPNFQKYFCEPSDYVPQWTKSAEFNLAPSQFEIVLQDNAGDPVNNYNTKFYRNT